MPDESEREVETLNLRAQLTAYWCAQVGEVMGSFLQRKGMETRRNWKRPDYQNAVRRLLAGLAAEQLQAEADELTQRGIRWQR